MVAFLAETPLPKIRESINGLRSQARAGTEVTDAALLRRLMLKHCVYGADVSPMGAEIATLSLWLASFVPGLSLAYLGRNVVVGNALIGVVSTTTVVPDGTLQAETLSAALTAASEAAAKVADIDDRTPAEVEASRVADEETAAATARLRRLFDLWTAEGFGLDEARFHAGHFGPDVLAGTPGDDTRRCLDEATELAETHRFLHWPLEFPRVFLAGRGGFDAVVGNPPWEEVVVERLAFYGMHMPGLLGLSAPERQAAIDDLLDEYPELEEQLEREQERVLIERGALASGEYDSTGGDPDLYKYFCQRYRSLVRSSGMIGVVLPGSTLATRGSGGFRNWLYSEMTAQRIDTLINKRLWAFDSNSNQQVALITAERSAPPPGHSVEIAGVAESQDAWEAQTATDGIDVATSSFGAGWLTPRLRSQAEADLLKKMRIGTPFPMGSGGQWKCFAVAELHETNDRPLWEDARRGRPLWSGRSFGQFDPHGGRARKCPTNAAVLKKIRKPRPGSGSIIAGQVSQADRKKAVRNALEGARVAYRGIARSTDPRTVIACLVPPRVYLTNAAPYLAFVDGRETDQSVCLGLLNSLPFDWQTRRYVDRNMNIFLLESFIVPEFDDTNYELVARAAARLSAVDDRFADFAAAVGVEYGPLTADEREHLCLDIDARVAHAWQLTHEDLDTMFADYGSYGVAPAYRDALAARVRELD